MLCPRDRKEANATLFFSNETSLANVIGGMKHRRCSSEDANVAKIDFMCFNPEFFALYSSFFEFILDCLLAAIVYINN